VKKSGAPPANRYSSGLELATYLPVASRVNLFSANGLERQRLFLLATRLYIGTSDELAGKARHELHKLARIMNTNCTAKRWRAKIFEQEERGNVMRTPLGTTSTSSEIFPLAWTEFNSVRRIVRPGSRPAAVNHLQRTVHNFPTAENHLSGTGGNSSHLHPSLSHLHYKVFPLSRGLIDGNLFRRNNSYRSN
jgi:hypothetical protein